MSTDPDPIIAKVRALLKKGSCKSTTQEEAKAFLAKAQELMTKYGIDNMPLEEEGGALPQYEFTTYAYKTGRQKYEDDDFIPMIIKECFGVKCFYFTYTELNESFKVKRRHAYLLAGTPVDVEIAKIVIDQLHVSMRAGAFAHLRLRGIEKPDVRIMRAYYEGVVIGYVQANEQGRARAYAQEKKADVDKYAIVLVNKDAALTKFVEENLNIHKDKRSGARDEYDDAFAKAAGFAQGRTMDLDDGKKRIEA